MYDSLKIVCYSDSNVINSLTDVHSRVNSSTGEIYHSGKLDNINVFQSSNKVFLGSKSSGFSLPKFYLGNNVQSLTLAQTKEAFEKLSDTLHLNLNDADVKRIDLATTFIMSSPVSSYNNCLCGIPRYKNGLWNDTVYFYTGVRQLCFYDKQVESNDKHTIIPEYYQDKNLLRYELRYLKRLPAQLKCPQVNVGMLYNKIFYRQLLENWQNEYFRIEKKRNFIMNDNVPLKNTHTVCDALVLQCVRLYYGGESEFIKLFDNLYKENKIPIYFRNRIRAKIKSISKKPAITQESDLIKELDHKVKLAVGFQLDNC